MTTPDQSHTDPTGGTDPHGSAGHEEAAGHGGHSHAISENADRRHLATALALLTAFMITR